MSRCSCCVPLSSIYVLEMCEHLQEGVDGLTRSAEAALFGGDADPDGSEATHVRFQTSLADALRAYLADGDADYAAGDVGSAAQRLADRPAVLCADAWIGDDGAVRRMEVDETPIVRLFFEADSTGSIPSMGALGGEAAREAGEGQPAALDAPMPICGRATGDRASRMCGSAISMEEAVVSDVLDCDVRAGAASPFFRTVTTFEDLAVSDVTPVKAPPSEFIVGDFAGIEEFSSFLFD